VRKQLEDLVILGHVTGLLVREDELAVGKDVEYAQAAHGDPRLDAQFFFDEFLQAPGPSAMLSSNQAALDLDVHRLKPVYNAG
jgi:hypothetical protein